MTITESLNQLIENITGQDNPKPETINECLNIYYTGTQAEWESISGISGAGFKGTETIHYEYTPE